MGGADGAGGDHQGLPPGYRQGEGIPPEVPSSPPPSYEQVLAENRLAAEAAAREAEGAAEALGACAVPEKERKEEKKERREKKEKAKSSKEQYRQLAAQWGITCKMSDKCRCLECQSRYFDCEYEQNEQEKTDGGLGAGTPMFISEVMGGTACSLL
ncbi:uncharacterized protein [Hetaerina americana]|uniref:uncharacterized protein n=1 Tax=Hetaerina americana TaxID=62018 RepID=UPI003A7F2E74